MWDDVEEETPAQPEPAPEGDAATAQEAAPEAAPEAAQETKPEEAETPVPLNPVDSNEPRRLLFKHWIR